YLCSVSRSCMPAKWWRRGRLAAPGSAASPVVEAVLATMARPGVTVLSALSDWTTGVPGGNEVRSGWAALAPAVGLYVFAAWTLPGGRPAEPVRWVVSAIVSCPLCGGVASGGVEATRLTLAVGWVPPCSREH